MQPEQGDLALFQLIATRLPSPLPGVILSAMAEARLEGAKATTGRGFFQIEAPL